MQDLTLRQVQGMPFPGILEHEKDRFGTKLTAPRVNFSCLNKKTGRVARRGGVMKRGGSWFLVEEQLAVGCLGKRDRQTGMVGEAGREEAALQGDEPFRYSLLTTKPEMAGGSYGAVDCLCAKTLPKT